jgi:uncharacterized protein (TIGR02284 family)
MNNHRFEKRGEVMTDQKVLRTLRNLYRIADAGEKGFATAAANMDVPALVIFFKLHAQQRLSFKNEILAELRRLGDTSRPGISIPGAIHRGRVAIFAGMSDGAGQEQVILKEAAIGERVAERTYQKALARDLPEETRRMVERQYAEVSKASAKVRCLRDDVQRRDAIRLAGSEQDTRQAVQLLISGGFNPNEIETMRIDDQSLYDGGGATQAETILSGIVGGALWGGLMGVLAGFGVVATTAPVGLNMVILTWVLTVLGFVLVGAFISGVLAFFISAGTSTKDNYQYPEIRENAHFLVHAMPCAPAE